MARGAGGGAGAPRVGLSVAPRDVDVGGDGDGAVKTRALAGAAVPRAAGIGVVWRDTGAGLFGAAAGLSLGAGANIAISTERPPKPIASAIPPQMTSAFTDMPADRAWRE